MSINGRNKLSLTDLRKEAEIRLANSVAGENVMEAKFELDEDGNITPRELGNLRALLNLIKRRDILGETRKKCESMLEFLSDY